MRCQRGTVMKRFIALALTFLCFGLLIAGCGRSVKDAPIERMSPQRPAWLNQPAGQCERGMRCVVVQGEAADLGDARSMARAKGVSELVSELAVRIRSTLSIREDQGYSDERVSESGGMSQTLEARVRGQLVGVRTLSVYWERRFAYTSNGTVLSYQTWLTVGVPIVTLTALRDDAKQRTSNYENDVNQLTQRLSALSKGGTGCSSAEAVRLLEDARALIGLRDQLMIESPAGNIKLEGILSRLKSGVRHLIKRRKSRTGSVVSLESTLTLFGGVLAGVGFEVSGLKNGALASKAGNLTPGGGLELNLTGVRYLEGTSFVLSLLTPELVSLQVELAPVVPVVPVEIELVAHSAQELGTLIAAAEQRILSAHPSLVRCSQGMPRCFKLVVNIDLLTSKPKMARMVYQSRGTVRVALDALPLVRLEPIERNLVGVGSSVMQSRRHLRVVVLDEIHKLTAKILSSL
jgi:hypothetical protein